MNSQISILHNQSMRHAEIAEVSRVLGQSRKYKQNLKIAYEYERQASELACRKSDYEPTRSVLLRSAASLALECGLNNDSEKLIAKALAGNPSTEIADELRSLLEEVYFERHMDLRGQKLTRHEFVMTLAGPGVSRGMISGDEFIKR